MKRTAAKLNSSRGAALVIAMLFFLICILVASVIITAATVNAGRTEKQRDEQQVYLAVSSAATLLQDDFKNLTPYVAERVRTEHTCGYAEHTATDGYTAWSTVQACTGSALADAVTQGAFSISQGYSIWEKSFTVESGEAELADLPVQVKITMDDSYHIKCALSTSSASGSSYAMTLSISGTPETTSALDDTTSCMHLEQSDEKYLVNGTWQYITIERYYTINITTETTTVTWSAGTLSKGD